MIRVGRKTANRPHEVWKKASAHKRNPSIFKILNKGYPAGKLPFLEAALSTLISVRQARIGGYVDRGPIQFGRARGSLSGIQIQRPQSRQLKAKSQ